MRLKLSVPSLMRDVRRHLIYVLAKDDRGLTAYPGTHEAVGACEGIDVEDGNYQFFASDGYPLKPIFQTPNRRGTVAVVSGTYSLQDANDQSGTDLLSQLKNVAYVDGCGLHSIEAVKARILEARTLNSI